MGRARDLVSQSLLKQLQQTFTVVRLLSLAFLVFLWANLAPGCLCILFPLVAIFLQRTPNESGITLRHFAVLLAVILLSMCLTPRGPLTIGDSARQIVPMLVETPEILRDTEWAPVWYGPVDAATAGALVLVLVTQVLHRFQEIRGPSDWLLLASIVSLGCWSRPNVSVLTVGLFQWSMTHFRKTIPIAIPRDHRGLGICVGSVYPAARCETSIGGAADEIVMSPPLEIV